MSSGWGRAASRRLMIMTGLRRAPGAVLVFVLILLVCCWPVLLALAVGLLLMLVR